MTAKSWDDFVIDRVVAMTGAQKNAALRDATGDPNVSLDFDESEQRLSDLLDADKVEMQQMRNVAMQRLKDYVEENSRGS